MDTAMLDVIAPMIVGVVLILTVGGVALLRPLSKRLGDLLEVMVEEKRNPALTEDLHHIRSQLETMGSRLALIEERQDFQERLLADPAKPRRVGRTAEDLDL